MEQGMLNGHYGNDALRHRSMAEILAAIGDCPDLTLVHGPGNRGDELICEGTRNLLRDRRFRDIAIDELGCVAGRIGLLAGSGAFSRAYHEWMPRALALAERRFERVIVLPSSFDVTVDAVRAALERTRAVVFARELTSFEAIRPLCDARLALDGAFYFDYGPYWRDGAGVLNAFRTDREAPPDWTLPDDNVDISVSAMSLTDWLEQIARHALVRTNRAHVMIAAALLGKTVEVGPCSDPKVAAIADYALSDFPLRRIAAATPRRARPTRRHPRAEAVTSELTLLADGGVDVTPEAIERLKDELDSHPQSLAVAPRIVDPSGAVLHCGGDVREWEDLVEFRFSDIGRAAEDDASRPCDWVPHTAVLVRTEILADHPLDAAAQPYADKEWSYRLRRTHDDAFRACPAVTVEQHWAPRGAGPGGLPEPDFRAMCTALPALSAIARIYQLHGRVLSDLFEILPTLTDADGTRNLPAARTLLTLLDAIGGDRFLELWAGGQLAQLLVNQAAALQETQSTAERLAARVSAVETTRAWRLARTYYRVRDHVQQIVRRP
jgi:hypothetical protein